MRAPDVIRMLVVDDSVEMLDSVVSLCSLLRGVEVVAKATSAVQALAVVRDVGVDLVLMDIRMPGMNGFEAARRLLKGSRPPRIVLFTMDEAEGYAEAARAAGAHAFLNKLDLQSDLLPAIQRCGFDMRRTM